MEDIFVCLRFVNPSVHDLLNLQAASRHTWPTRHSQTKKIENLTKKIKNIQIRSQPAAVHQGVAQAERVRSVRLASVQ